jgi:2',3'-cyclic-nucleotide 2'-phosphodiesterase (5'-nucleotidase family)
VSFTILHTNDFHGNLELSGSNPGAARTLPRRSQMYAHCSRRENVLRLDGGDIMQGSLLSNLQKGLPTIDYYRTIGYNAATSATTSSTGARRFWAIASHRRKRRPWR